MFIGVHKAVFAPSGNIHVYTIKKIQILIN